MQTRQKRVRKERRLSLPPYTCWRERERGGKRALLLAAPRRVNYAACVGDDRTDLINDIDPGRLPSVDAAIARWKH